MMSRQPSLPAACAEARARIDAPHGLDDAARAALTAHVASCDACRTLAAVEARIAPAFARTPALTPSPRLTAALMAVPNSDRRRVFAYVPLAWGSLAAVALVAFVTWLAVAPGNVARRSPGDGATNADPTAALALGAAPASDPGARRADLGQPSAIPARRVVPTPTSPRSRPGAVAALLRPATTTPAALVMAMAGSAGPGDDARARERNRDDERRPAGTPNPGGSGDDSREILVVEPPNKSRSIEPTVMALPPTAGPPAATDAAVPATLAAPTTPATPDNGRRGGATPGATESPPLPPGSLPGTPPATEAPGRPPIVATPDDPTPTATPSATPTATATSTGTPTATATPGIGPTATPQAIPSAMTFAMPW